MSILHRRKFLQVHNDKQKEGKTDEGQNSKGPLQEGQHGSKGSGPEGRQEGSTETPVDK